MTTMTSADRFVTGGVDTHRDFHVAAALDQLGGVLGTAPDIPAFFTFGCAHRACGTDGRSLLPGRRSVAR
jgi:hypothetical protein